MRSLRLLAVTVLAVILALSSVQSGLAVTELAYDDGSEEGGSGQGPGAIFAVLFSLPSGWSSAKLVTAKYYISASATDPTKTFTVRILHSNKVNLITPFDVTPTGAGWFHVTVNVVVYGDFYIVIQYGEPNDKQPSIGVDSDGTQYGRSFGGYIGQEWTELTSNRMIRAEVEEYIPPPAPTPAPVGGIVESVNKLAVFAPYLALFGIVVTIAIVVVAPWKKPDTN